MRFASIGDSTTSKPPTVTRPALGGMKPVIMRMVVDLPAPLGPRKPSTSPRSTVNEMPSTARLGPKAFTRLSILIISESAAGFKDCGLQSRRRFSHKPKEQDHEDVRKIPGRHRAVGGIGPRVRAAG